MQFSFYHTSTSLLCHAFGILLLKLKKIAMFCQGKSYKHTLCANAEPDSVVLTQAKFPMDSGDCRSGTRLSPNPHQGFEEYHRLANVHIDTIYSLEVILHYFGKCS